ncbi:hypothetical protein NQ314_004164, partial [Rhamnusium bicolor]
MQEPFVNFVFNLEPSPQLTKMNDMDILMEDSLDGGPPSVGSGEIPVVVPTPGTNTPVTPATTKKIRALLEWFSLLKIFECLWDSCDYQFEEVADLIEHCIKDKDTQGHVQAYFQENQGADFHCHWRNCSRNKKNLQPLPNLARLIRHVRDMHINKGNGRSVAPENRS